MRATLEHDEPPVTSMPGSRSGAKARRQHSGRWREGSFSWGTSRPVQGCTALADARAQPENPPEPSGILSPDELLPTHGQHKSPSQDLGLACSPMCISENGGVFTEGSDVRERSPPVVRFIRPMQEFHTGRRTSCSGTGYGLLGGGVPKNPSGRSQEVCARSGEGEPTPALSPRSAPIGTTGACAIAVVDARSLDWTNVHQRHLRADERRHPPTETS